jgi:hypothetical protein
MRRAILCVLLPALCLLPAVQKPTEQETNKAVACSNSACCRSETGWIVGNSFTLPGLGKMARHTHRITEPFAFAFSHSS